MVTTVETSIGLDMRIKRVILQKHFPTLKFEFHRSAERMLDLVRVMRTNEDAIQYYDEVIDPETFPTDEFIARCALIA